MTEYTIKNSVSAPVSAASTAIPFVAEKVHPTEFERCATRIFDIYMTTHFRIACGPTVFDVNISEENDGIRNSVICRITDATRDTKYTQRGKACCAVQIQAIGWILDLANFEQVKAVLNDKNNPEELKTVIRHLIKGDMPTVGDPHVRKMVNNVRYKILSARRKNDRYVVKSI